MSAGTSRGGSGYKDDNIHRRTQRPHPAAEAGLAYQKVEQNWSWLNVDPLTGGRHRGVAFEKGSKSAFEQGLLGAGAGLGHDGP